MEEKKFETPETDTDTDANHKDFMDTIFEKGRKLYKSAAFKSGVYVNLVEKRIEFSSVNKKIAHAYADLGRLVYQIHESGKKTIFTNEDVKTVMETLTAFKAQAQALEEEIELLREAEEKPEGTQEH